MEREKVMKFLIFSSFPSGPCFDVLGATVIIFWVLKVRILDVISVQTASPIPDQDILLNCLRTQNSCSVTQLQYF